MKFKESKVLVQLDDLISKKIIEDYIEDLADDVWDEGGESVIKDLYEGEDRKVFGKYMKNEKIDISDDCRGALDEIYYNALQALKAKILGILMVRIYDREYEVKDLRVLEVDELIDRYIELVAKKDLDILSREIIYTRERPEVTEEDIKEYRKEVFSTMKATHTAFILNNALNYDPREIQSYR